MVRSNHQRKKIRAKSDRKIPRQQSEYGTKSYRDSLQRAFTKMKEQVFFNPDMQYFVTLTYRGLETDLDKVMQDIKIWLKHERRKHDDDIKYLWIAEWQKRGSLHIHMITNAKFEMRKNKNGHNEISYWADNHGYTSVLHISDLDENFKPYYYLFKYMHKTARIGKSFIHVSRNLNNYKRYNAQLDDLTEWITVNQEITEAKINNTRFIHYRNYLCYDENVPLNQLNERNQKWHNRLQSTRELEKILKNHSRL